MFTVLHGKISGRPDGSSSPLILDFMKIIQKPAYITLTARLYKQSSDIQSAKVHLQMTTTCNSADVKYHINKRHQATSKEKLTSIQ